MPSTKYYKNPDYVKVISGKKFCSQIKITKFLRKIKKKRSV